MRLNFVEHIHTHGLRAFRSDIAFVSSVLVATTWLVDEFSHHHQIDVLGAVTVVSFILLFLLERSHGKEMKAIHLKLDELLAAQVGASNRLIRAEEASEISLEQAHEALHVLAAQKAPHEVVSIENTNFFDEFELCA